MASFLWFENIHCPLANDNFRKKNCGGLIVKGLAGDETLADRKAQKWITFSSSYFLRH